LFCGTDRVPLCASNLRHGAGRPPEDEKSPVAAGLSAGADGRTRTGDLLITKAQIGPHGRLHEHEKGVAYVALDA